MMEEHEITRIRTYSCTTEWLEFNQNKQCNQFIFKSVSVSISQIFSSSLEQKISLKNKDSGQFEQTF